MRIVETIRTGPVESGVAASVVLVPMPSPRLAVPVSVCLLRLRGVNEAERREKGLGRDGIQAVDHVRGPAGRIARDRDGGDDLGFACPRSQEVRPTRIAVAGPAITRGGI